tara:strand:- start:144 stop:1805 length:1662 start_codon:yes stop_codon:yes gene_type:complete
MSLDVKNTTAVASDISSSKPYDDGALAVDSVSAITHTSNGLNYTANQRLAMSLQASVSRVVNGIPLDSAGRVAMSSGDVNHYANGFPFTINGQISVNQLARYFLGFDSVLNSYGQLETAWTPTGSFKISFNFSTTISSTRWIYSRYDPTSNERSVMIRCSNNSMEFYVSENGTDFVTVSTAYSPVGKFSSGVATFNANNNIILEVDGVTETQSHAYASVYDADTSSYIGSQLGSSNFFQGVLADFELIDIDTPSNSQPYRLDRATGNYELPTNNVTGSELVTNGTDLVNTDGWGAYNNAVLSVSNGKLLVTNGTGAYGYTTKNVPTVVGATYEFKVDVDYTSDNGRVRLGTSNGGSEIFEEQNVNTDKTVATIFTATTTTTYVRVGLQNNVIDSFCAFGNISVKQVTNALVYNNIPEASRFQAQLVGADWVGNELVTNGDFATDSDWNKQTGWTIGSGVASSDGTANANISQFSVVEAGKVYLASIAITDYTSGSIDINIGDSTRQGAFGTVDTHTVVVIAESAEAVFYQSNLSSGFIGSIDNVTVKRILEAP